MTYVTGFFLVFAGMLIGYFLWYRDRSGEEQLRLTLGRENEDLRTSLTMANNSNSILEERFTRQKGQLNVLQQLCDDWSSGREQAERDRAQLEVEADDKRQKYEAASAELQNAKQHLIELEDQLHAVNQQHLQDANQQEQDFQKKLTSLEANLTQRKHELKSTVKENERLSKSLHQSESKIAELNSEIESNRNLLETATKNAGGLKQEYVSLESSLKESADLLKESRSQYAAAMSEKNVAQQSLAELKEQHEKLQAESQELRSKISNMSVLQHEVVSLKQSLENNTEKLDKVTKQRDLALKSEQTSLAMAAGLQTRIDNQESTIHGLREKHNDALQGAKRELEIRAELESSFDKQQAEWHTLKDEQQKKLEVHSSELTSRFSQKSGELQKRLADQTGTVAELTRERNHLTSELQSATEELNQTKMQLTEFKQKNQQLAVQVENLHATRLQITELKEMLSASEAKIETESAEIRLKSARIDELEMQCQQRDELSDSLDRELTDLRRQYQVVQKHQSELQARMNEHAVTREKFESLKIGYAARMQSLQTKLKSSEQTIRSLRRERAGVLARLANYRTVSEPDATVISFKQAMQERKRETFCEEYRGHTEVHAERGLVYTSKPESCDDLKRISGIAEVLEARLNDFGIYTYKQIMEWKPATIEEFSRLFAFRDRIERDDWQGQAKFFYHQKHNQPAAA